MGRGARGEAWCRACRCGVDRVCGLWPDREQGKSMEKKERKKWAIFVFLKRAKNGNLLSVCLFRFRQQQTTVYGSMGRVHRNKGEKVVFRKNIYVCFQFCNSNLPNLDVDDQASRCLLPACWLIAYYNFL
jgi:hypothetical protein